MTINYTRLPEGLREEMRLYMESGVRPGSFLTLFLSNDLTGAMQRADEINRHRFFDICLFLYNDAPGGSYGSPDHVREWVSLGGLDGSAAA